MERRSGRRLEEPGPGWAGGEGDKRQPSKEIKEQISNPAPPRQRAGGIDGVNN